MPRSTLIIVGGLATDTAAQVAAAVARQQPSTLIHHDLRALETGFVRRTVRTPYHGTDERALRLAHGCVSCTLREDLLPMLHAMARDGVARIVLHLDPALEAESVCWALSEPVLQDGAAVIDVLDVAAVVTAVDGDEWLAAATGDEPLDETGIAVGDGDDRTLAQVAVGGVAFADALVIAGTADPATLAVLDRLAPAAAVSTAELFDAGTLLSAIPATARRGTPEDPHGPLSRGCPPLHAEHGVSLTAFTARRPFHPQRLYHAVEELLDGVVTSWGRIWLASKPGAALWLESAGGGLRIGEIGPWLCAEPAEAWDDADPQRRTMAALRWDRDWGDREQHLMVLATDPDSPERVRQALSAALLTDGEVADGTAAWRTLPDPFTFVDGEPEPEPQQDGGARR